MSRASTWTYRLALATVASTFILLLAGGLVHATDSGLACPDWPTCYGSLMPEMKGGVAIEHSHRLIATFVGLLTIALAISIHRTQRGRPALVRLGWGALALVIFQGVLGGMTVIFKLPTVVSSSHLATAMIYLAVVIALAHQLRPDPPAVGSPRGPSSAPRRWTLFAAIAVYLQIVLGAVVRHTDVGLACSDIPLCKGALWLVGADPRVQLHMAHRVGAIVASAMVIMAAVNVLRWGADDARGRALACGLAGVTALQIGLGFASVHSALEVFTVTAHLGLGAALWGGSVALWLRQPRAPAAEV